MRLEASRPRLAASDQPRNDALEMRNERRLPCGRRLRSCIRGVRGRLAWSSFAHDANRAAPIVEDRQDIGFAELDAHRTPAPGRRLLPLAVAIDPSARDLDRNALLAP